MLWPPEHFAFDLALIKDGFDLFDNVVDEVMPFVQFLVDVFDEKFIRLGFEVFEAQVLQLALDLRNTQPARKRGVDVQRFARHAQLPLF